MSRKLKKILAKHSGRDSQGHVSVRHQGGRHKRFWRRIDFKRDKREIPGKVIGLEYDPNRGVGIALIQYPDGEKRYILAPVGLKVGDQLIAGKKAELKPGHALTLKKIPVGAPIHNVELMPGRGGQLARGAGTAVTIQAKAGQWATLKMPSGEVRLVSVNCLATIGQLANVDLKNRNLGKAGRKRRLGIRPSVRGVAQHPDSHPHGGGEGRSGIGMPSPKSPWGKKTLGKKTRQKIKYSDKLILKRRK